VQQRIKNCVGITLGVTGSFISLVGALANNLWLDHNLAMLAWMASNPLLLAYFIGVDMRWWNGQHLSTRALIVLYLIFTVSNAYGLTKI
jgi:hypothetical protein